MCFSSVGESIRSYGIKMMTADASGAAPDFPADGEVYTSDTDDSADETNSAPAETNKKEETVVEEPEAEPEETKMGETATTLKNDEGAPIGLIIGIAAGAVVIVAAVVVVLVVLKKKKK